MLLAAVHFATLALLPPPPLVSAGIGFCAGSAGAFVVYPIDFVKTQLQTTEGRRQYSGLPDAFVKIVARDGFLSLYRGCGVQVLGVAPEKALKLTVNDAARSALKSSFGSLNMASEIAAGVVAGSCQVVVTNPLEVVKVRLQTDPRRLSVLATLRELGLAGLFQGGGACVLRDASFSAILFPTYRYAKEAFGVSAGHSVGPFWLFLSGLLAAAPAAFCTTPLDVIKTRQQAARCESGGPGGSVVVESKTRRSTETLEMALDEVCDVAEPEARGLLDVARSVVDEEGAAVLFSGALERVLRSAPQFGVTLALYDVLNQLAQAQGLLPPPS